MNLFGCNGLPTKTQGCKFCYVFSPAKINLLLMVTEKRPDHYHNLVSLIAPLTFGDDLTLHWCDEEREDRLFCDFPGLPTDGSNLILKAVKNFRRYFTFSGSVSISLTKRIPLEAGLGGGSSNATATLRGLNTLFGNPLSPDKLRDCALEVGSDCPLFFHRESVVMRGRGEKIERCRDTGFLKDFVILLFKPDFSIRTKWVYEQMREYTAKNEAEARLKAFVQRRDLCLYNDLEKVVFRKYLALPVLLEKLRLEYKIPCLMSGSGSSCFALVTKNHSAIFQICETIKDSWGQDTFLVKTEVANVS